MNEIIEAADRFGGLNRSMANHPAGKAQSPKEQALEELQLTCELMEDLKRAYEEVIFKCKDLGIPNTVIAKRAGRTEAAIRMFVSRKRGQ